jgi:hypothetical protein
LAVAISGGPMGECCNNCCEEGEALPCTLYIQEERFCETARVVAITSPEQRLKRQFIFLKAGKYRANTKKAVLYNHHTNQNLKARLLSIRQCLVRDITHEEWKLIGCGATAIEKKDFLSNNFRRHNLKDDSMVTLFMCDNIRGKLVKDYLRMVQRDYLKARGSSKE